MTPNNKLLIAILVVLVAIAILLSILFVHKFFGAPETPMGSTTSSTTSTATTAKPTTSTTTTTTTTTTGSASGNQPSDEVYVYDIYLYDVDPDNDGYRILGLDPDYLAWQSPPDTLTIPKTINGKQVTAIGNNAFRGVQSSTIVLPEGLLDIYKEAFYNSGARSINIPSTVIYIGEAAFKKCHFLQSISIPNGVNQIKKETFRECTNLASIILPNSLETIGLYAFAQCKTPQTVKIPRGCDVDSTAFNNSEITVEYN